MLDKTVPYIDVLMRRPAGSPVPAYSLPEGFSFSFFKPGNERDWAIIETSVLEFPSEIDALLYYQRNWLHFGEELERRCLFIESPEGEKVATTTAFWAYNGMRRQPWFEWVSVKPSFQGLGLGKAVFYRAIDLMLEIEGDQDFYLHTQTWSHPAIRLYEKAGFAVTDERNLRGYANDRSAEAVALLNEIHEKNKR